MASSSWARSAAASASRAAASSVEAAEGLTLAALGALPGAIDAAPDATRALGGTVDERGAGALELDVAPSPPVAGLAPSAIVGSTWKANGGDESGTNAGATYASLGSYPPAVA